MGVITPNWQTSSELIEEIHKTDNQFIGITIIQQLSYLIKTGYVERENPNIKNGHGQKYRIKVKP